MTSYAKHDASPWSLKFTKDLGFKAEISKDLDFGKAKDLEFKAKDLEIKAKAKDLEVQGQGLENRSLRTGKDQRLRIHHWARGSKGILIATLGSLGFHKNNQRVDRANPNT